MSSILIAVLVVALAGGGAFYWLNLRKPKPDNKAPVDLDDYDFGEDEDDTPWNRTMTQEDRARTAKSVYRA